MNTHNAIPTTCMKPSSNHGINRVVFDPENPKHRMAVEAYYATGKWVDVQFYAESPYLTVQETITRKLLPYYFQRDKFSNSRKK